MVYSSRLLELHKDQKLYKGLLFNVAVNPHDSRSLGVYRIAHHLREQNLDIEVIDWANFWSIEQLIELFKSRYTKSLKFVGLSFLFNHWSQTIEKFCAWIKTQYPDIKIIGGGSSNPEFYSKYIDYFIVGFGEHAIDTLLKYIISNGPAPMFNLTAPNGIKTIDAIHSYPAFPMNSLMVKYQDRDFVESHEWLTIECARGCMFSCKFCNFPVLGIKEDTSRTKLDFLEQINDAYDRFGVTNYLIADETFNDRPEKIIKFADAVQDLSFTPWFSAFIRPDLLVSRPADREHLLRMNLLGQFFGVESFNHSSAKAVGKGMNTTKLLDGLLEAKEFFLNHGSKKYLATISIIIGLPFDTRDDMIFTRNWLFENWQTQAFTTFPLIIPLGEIMKKSAISLDYEKYGYRKMSEDTYRKFQTAGADKSIHDYHQKKLIWENDHMNYFQALEYQDYIDSIRYDQTNFFGPGPFHLASRCKNFLGLEEKLKISAAHFQDHLDHDITAYIQKKLNL